MKDTTQNRSMHKQEDVARTSNGSHAILSVGVGKVTTKKGNNRRTSGLDNETKRNKSMLESPLVFPQSASYQLNSDSSRGLMEQ